MPADNGIYILETRKYITRFGINPNEIVKERDGYEYRVRELQCIENLYYDKSTPSPNVNHWNTNWETKERQDYETAYKNKWHSHNSDVLINNARIMWDNCLVYSKIENALMYAAGLERDINKQGFPLEYGISFIRIGRTF